MINKNIIEIKDKDFVKQIKAEEINKGGVTNG